MIYNNTIAWLNYILYNNLVKEKKGKDGNCNNDKIIEYIL